MAKRHGKMAEGWARRGVQLPAALDDAFGQEAEQWGYNAVKLLSTASFALLMGLPADVRENLFFKLMQMQREGPDAFTPEAVWQLLSDAKSTAALVRGIESDSDRDLWFWSTVTGWADDRPMVDPMQDARRRHRESTTQSEQDVDTPDDVS